MILPPLVEVVLNQASRLNVFGPGIAAWSRPRRAVPLKVVAESESLQSRRRHREPRPVPSARSAKPVQSIPVLPAASSSRQ